MVEFVAQTDSAYPATVTVELLGGLRVPHPGGYTVRLCVCAFVCRCLIQSRNNGNLGIGFPPPLSLPLPPPLPPLVPAVSQGANFQPSCSTVTCRFRSSTSQTQSHTPYTSWTPAVDAHTPLLRVCVCVCVCARPTVAFG